MRLVKQCLSLVLGQHFPSERSPRLRSMPTAYATLNAENAVAKVDVASRKLVGEVKVGIGPIQVVVTPDNKYVLVDSACAGRAHRDQSEFGT